MLAAAGAVDLLALEMPGLARDVLACFLVAIGVLSAVVAWIRWAAAERAIRRRRPLPSFGYALLITVGLVVAGGVIIVGVF